MTFVIQLRCQRDESFGEPVTLRVNWRHKCPPTCDTEKALVWLGESAFTRSFDRAYSIRKRATHAHFSGIHEFATRNAAEYELFNEATWR